LYQFAHQSIWVYVFTSLEQDFTRLAALPLDTWSYFAASYNNQTLRLYVSGTQIVRKALILMEAPSSASRRGTAGAGPTPSREAEPSCTSPRNNSRFPVAVTGTLGPGPSGW
jgi:hypothetical protein